DKFFVKQYELETNFVCHLLLDISASMRYGEGQQQKLLYASRMAATLGYSIVRQSDKVSLATFDSRVRGFVSPSNSMDQIVRMTQHLDDVDAVEKTSMADCLMEVSTRMGRREIVVVFSDFFTDLDELESAVHRLRYNRHEVVLFQVLHHDELTFEFDTMTKFVGLEIPEELLVQP
ncbi:MAG: VWA domain-containing protein, partial [Planctomycetes bacterium]|nr:VWA domain-containing protein [Planctomycetota bacterium]